MVNASVNTTLGERTAKSVCHSLTTGLGYRQEAVKQTNAASVYATTTRDLATSIRHCTRTLTEHREAFAMIVSTTPRETTARSARRISGETRKNLSMTSTLADVRLDIKRKLTLDFRLICYHLKKLVYVTNPVR